ncbi:MAG: hypothetical protein GX030_04530 [Firmicutes bacterium]|nr:hypothetical protein [Bacillota bacterium]
MRPRAKKLWEYLQSKVSIGDSWYGTYSDLSQATQLSKKEVANAVKELEENRLVKKINHGRAGIQLALIHSNPRAAGDQINNCGWCGTPVEHPDYIYCTHCGKALRP